MDATWQAKAWIAEHNAKPGDAIYDNGQTEAGAGYSEVIHPLMLLFMASVSASVLVPARKVAAPPMRLHGFRTWRRHRLRRAPRPQRQFRLRKPSRRQGTDARKYAAARQRRSHTDRR